MTFDFFMPARVLTGENCILSNSARLRPLGKRCLIVTGRHSARACGALDDVTAALELERIGWSLFDQVGQNPLLDTCKQAGDAARSFGAEFIIGIGGGSPLDAAKAAAVFAANNLEPMDIYKLDWPVPALPTVMVGTTAGTGSEVGPAAVLTKPDGHKQSISREDLMPRLTFGDARYTASLPLNFTVSTALDALSHALEGYFSLAASSITDLFAVEATAILCDTLPELCAAQSTGDIPMRCRERLYYASVLAGLTLCHCGTCYCHNLGYYLTENYGIAHGTACAAFLPSFLQRQCALLPEKAKLLFARADTDLEGLCSLMGSLLPDLSHITIPPEDIRQLARAGAKTKNFTRTAPSGYTEEEAAALLEQLFGG